MDSKKIDRRVKYTKAQLKEALIALMLEKPLYKISIKEICEKSDINRSTFYAHYNTQYDLYEEIITESTDDIKQIVSEYPKDRKGIDTVNMYKKILNYVEKNEELCLVLLSDNGNLTAGEALNSILEGVINDRLIETNEDGLDKQTSSYLSLFVMSGMISILWKWLNDKNRVPAQDLAWLMFAMTSRISRSYNAAMIKKNAQKENNDSGT